MKLKRTITDTLCVFMYLFGFSLKGGRGIDSTMILCACIAVFAFLNKDFMKSCLQMLKNRFVLTVTGTYMIINLWACVCLLVNRSTDFAFLKTFLHVFFQIAVGVFLYKFLEFRGTKERITEYVVLAFTAQTVIQWLACFVPLVRQIINYTKDADTIAKGLSYGGIRAIALCDSNFFGLSAAYALIALLFWSEKNTMLRNNRVLKLLHYCIMMTGTFFAGRTGFVGVAFAVLYLVVMLFVNRKNGKAITISKEEKKAGLAFLIAAGVALVTGIVLFITVARFRWLINFAFQPIIELFSKGTMMISSMQSLLNMYIDIPTDSLLFGHGLYNGYYMGTDVGYLRVILYMGIIGFVLMLLMQLVIIQPHKGEEKIMKAILLLCLLMLNLKGEVITWAMVVLGVGLLYCLQDNHSVDNLIIGE